MEDVYLGLGDVVPESDSGLNLPFASDGSEDLREHVGRGENSSVPSVRLSEEIIDDGFSFRPDTRVQREECLLSECKVNGSRRVRDEIRFRVAFQSFRWSAIAYVRHE